MKKELVFLWGDELKEPIKRNYRREIQSSVLGNFLFGGYLFNGFS